MLNWIPNQFTQPSVGLTIVLQQKDVLGMTSKNNSLVNQTANGTK